jgi:hypothetical protein
MYLMKRPYLKIYTNDLDIKIICAILLPYGFTHNQIVELYKTTYLYNIQIISTINFVDDSLYDSLYDKILK